VTGLPCDRVRANLAWFVGGDLDAVNAEAVRAHLFTCVACRNEAAALHRSSAALAATRERASEVAGVDDAMFTAMHAEILARVDAAEAAAAGAGPLTVAPRLRTLWLGAAALALVGAGFWWGQLQGEGSVWERPAMATPAVHEAPKAVPWSGPRAPMRWLGNDSEDRGPELDAEASGLRAREELRSLVDDSLVLPRPRRNR
jgi:anti-sigma factor RsiW